MNNSLQEYVNFANKLADVAGITSMEYFRTSLDIDNKSDESPVTIADKNTELKIRSMIEKEYPNHGILGEEFDSINPNAEFIWVIDPIDGTRSYIAGHKDFGNLISLTQNKKPIIGIINCPAHEERWVGVKNEHSTINKQVAKSSSITKIKDDNSSEILFNFMTIKFGKINKLNCIYLARKYPRPKIYNIPNKRHT